jgi:long-subunit acyl-CoA synthetase (AMP-forming)
MSRKTQEYFTSLDMPPLSIYGMTESAGAVTTWSQNRIKMYTCGFAIPGIDIKIDNPDKDG